ncbi:WG repeat-containing protein [Neolewinella persica]|uniref:WG repeat-containing protein n=1 Tax=Neolewinella persica TaxID=70998 RepID=UPI0003A1FCED|nr:WG repeat-containing protein [Neolewinella persica]
MKYFLQFLLLFTLFYSACAQTPETEEPTTSPSTSPERPPQVEGITLNTVSSRFTKAQMGLTYKFSKDKLQGMKYGDSIVIPFIYEELPYRLSPIMIAKLNGKFGMINDENETIVPFEYDRIRYHRSGIVIAVKDGKHGAIDLAGGPLIAFDYEDLSLPYFDVTSNKVIFKKDGKMGLMTKNEEVLVPAEFEMFYWVAPNRIVSAEKKEGKYSVLDSLGNMVAKNAFSSRPEYWHDGHFIIKQDNLYGIASEKGKTLIKPAYRQLKRFPLGYGYLGKNLEIRGENGYGVLSTNLKEIVPPQYEKVEVKPNGFTIVQSGDDFGVYTPTGEVLIPVGLHRIRSINTLHFRVFDKESALSKIIDTSGNVILKDLTQSFIAGAGEVIALSVNRPGSRMVSGSQMYDKAGNKISEEVYREIRAFLPFLRLEKDTPSRYAMFTSDGKPLTDFIYQRMILGSAEAGEPTLDHYRTRAARDGRWYALDQYGREREKLGVFVDPDQKFLDELSAKAGKKVEMKPYTGLTPQQEKIQKKVGETLTGYWYNSHVIEEGKVLEEITIDAEGKTTRILTWYDSEKKYHTFRQVYFAQFLGNSTVLIKPQYDWFVDTGGRTKLPAGLEKIIENRLEIQYNYGGSDPTLAHYVMGKDMGIELSNKSVHEVLVDNLIAQNKLRGISEGRPGGIMDPKYFIDLDQKTLTIGTCLPSYTLGKVAEDKDGLYLIPTTFQGSRTGAISGMIMQVRYIGPDGKMKQGNLQLELMNGSTMGIREVN